MSAIEVYLNALNVALSAAPAAEREAILAEVRAHLADILARGGDEAVDAAIARFGTAGDYAAAAVEAHGLDRALGSSNPFALVLAALRFAGGSALMLATASAAVVLLVFAAGFAAVAVADLVRPDQVGLFAGESGLTFGLAPDASRAASSEALGRWIIPMALIAALACAWAGAVMLRIGAKRRLSRLAARR